MSSHKGQFQRFRYKTIYGTQFTKSTSNAVGGLMANNSEPARNKARSSTSVRAWYNL